MPRQRATMTLLALLGGCQPAPELPPPLTLSAPGVSGVILPRPAAGCQPAEVQVGLWGPTWTTGPLVEARLTTEQDAVGAEVLWLEFPVETGLGQTTLALRLQGQEVRLPLGARPGEFELTLRSTPGALDAAAQQHAQEEAQQRIARAREAWARGEFLLRDGEATVGEVRLLGAESPPMVSVHDLQWLTPEPVAARRLDEGGDLLLQFPVEPSLQGEDGLLRINLLTRAVVVPSGPTPVAGVDRRLGLVPGRLTAAERQQAVQQAAEAADAREEELLRAQARVLVEEAARGGAGCRSVADLGEPWTELLAGYIVSIEPQTAGGCVLWLEPEVVQHRRRFSGTLP